jgi:alpha,alpha-trehalase
LPGGHGTGGEYVNQIGFGWTNGVILELLDKYGRILAVKDNFTIEQGQQPHDKSGSSSLVAHVMILTAISAAGFFL